MDQRSAQERILFGGFALAGALVVPRTESRLRGDVRHSGETGHISADAGQDDLGASFPDRGYHQEARSPTQKGASAPRPLRMEDPETPATSDAAEASLIPVPSITFWILFTSLARSSTRLLR